MAHVVPKNQSATSDVTVTNSIEEQEEQQESLNTVSSHLYLRPTHTSETLEKDVVLQRIRHRKRLNSVKNALQGVLGWSVPSKTDNKVSVVYEKRWVDDAFAAP